MADVPPVVRYVIPCEAIETDPDDPRKITLRGIVSAIRSLGEPPFPLRRREFRVFVMLTECRGRGDVGIKIVQADTGQVVKQIAKRNVDFGNDPLEVHGLRFRLRNCEFPEAGLYWIEFWYNDRAITQQALVLR